MKTYAWNFISWKSEYFELNHLHLILNLYNPLLKSRYNFIFMSRLQMVTDHFCKGCEWALLWKGKSFILKWKVDRRKQRHFWKGGGEWGATSHKHFCPPFGPERVLDCSPKMKKKLVKFSDQRTGGSVNPWTPSPKIRQWKDFSINLMLNFRNEFFFLGMLQIFWIKKMFVGFWRNLILCSGLKLQETQSNI